MSPTWTTRRSQRRLGAFELYFSVFFVLWSLYWRLLLKSLLCPDVLILWLPSVYWCISTVACSLCYCLLSALVPIDLTWLS